MPLKNHINPVAFVMRPIHFSSSFFVVESDQHNFGEQQSNRVIRVARAIPIFLYIPKKTWTTHD